MKTIQINLLQQHKKPTKLADKFIFFALHYLRYIIILTQIVVIGVFFYRFSIDQQVIDLKESVSQKQEIMRISQPLIKEAQAVEAKTTIIKKLLSQQEKFSTVFNYIVSIIPQSATLNKLSITETNIDLAGTATDVVIIQTMYQRFKKDKLFKKIDLNEIVKTNELFTFSIRLTL